MDDLWGDDLPDDVIEECVLLASQATSTVPSSPKKKCASNKTTFEFKSPTAVLVNGRSDKHSFQKTKQSEGDSCLFNSSLISTQLAHSSETTDADHLVQENKRLTEENLIRSGETSILRAEIQQLRMLLERKEIEANQQLSSLKKEIKDMNSHHQKQFEATRTEMKFKELELEEMRTKCKRIELNEKDVGASFRPQTPIRESSKGPRFLNKNDFDSRPCITLEKKAVTTDAQIQTDSTKHFRLNPSNTGFDNFSTISTIVASLKHSILSEKVIDDSSVCCLLEELRFQMVDPSKSELSELMMVFHGKETGLIELICSALDTLKNTAQFRSYINFLNSWIVNVLPALDRCKSDRLLQLLLSEIRRLNFYDNLTLSTAIISKFGLHPICNRASGCLLEKAALQLKDTHKSLENEDKFRSASLIVSALSTMLSWSATKEWDAKKCNCIPHLLRTMLLIVQDITESCPQQVSPSESRLKILTQIFHLSLSILKARSQPWITFINAPAEVNRLFSILTAISEVAIPRDLACQINVSAFSGPGLGLL